MKKSMSVSGFRPNLTFLTEAASNNEEKDDAMVRRVLNGLIKDINHQYPKSMNIKDFLNKNLLVFRKLGLTLDEIDMLSEYVTY